MVSTMVPRSHNQTLRATCFEVDPTGATNLHAIEKSNAAPFSSYPLRVTTL
jgi:hypothetical protein